MLIRDVVTAIPPGVTYAFTPLGAQVAQRLRGLANLLEASAGSAELGPDGQRHLLWGLDFEPTSS